MKTDKRGMLWVDGVGDRRSKAILKRKFSVQNGGWQQNQKKRPVAAAKRAYNARSGGRLLTTEHP